MRRRANTQIDVNALSRAVRRPGIDPRSWCSIAIVQSLVVDPTEGAFCDVLLFPSNRRETARLGAAYAGSGWGIYAPPMVDDEVLVVAPSGDPAQGLVIVSRLWSAADVPPAQASQQPEDVVISVRPGKTIRVLAQGGGDVVLASETGKVKLGDESATRGVARLDDLVDGGTLVLAVAPAPPPTTGVAMTLTFTSPSGTTSTATVVLAGAISGTGGGTLTMSGQIDSASDKVVAT